MFRKRVLLLAFLIALVSRATQSNALLESSFDDQILRWNIEDDLETNGYDTNKTFKSTNEIKKQMNIIFPGTLWCGSGNRSKNFNDVGTYAKTDLCCRGHDNCQIIIPVGEVKFGLKNIGLFTRSHCNCDTQFYNCLKNSKTTVSKSIGITYFDILDPQCFKLDHPKSCLQTVRGKCIRYIFDRMKPPKYQWFDNPSFRNSSRLF